MIRQIYSLIILLFISLLGYSQSTSATYFDYNKLEIGSVDFNTTASEIGPSFVGSELWFSAFTDKNIRKLSSGKINEVYYSLFRTPLDSNEYISMEPRSFIEDFKSEYHKGPVSYCEKTDELFVTLSNTIQIDVEVDGIIVKKQQIRLRLVLCKFVEGKWTIIEEMPFNDPIYSVGHPAINTTGDTLFFTSNNPEQSIGGTDIFMVIRKDSTWGDPIVLDENINTVENEMFPFYHPSGMLIFASANRTNQNTGLDLYVSDLTPDGFSPAKPIDQLNTNYDDFGLVIHPSNKTGYFVSNRPGQEGDDDIYMFKITSNLMLVSGKVLDDFTGLPIKNTFVKLYSCFGEKLDSVLADMNGNFSFEVVNGKCYMVGASNQNYSENRASVSSDNRVELRLKNIRLFNLLVMDYSTDEPVPNAVIQIDNKTVGLTTAEGDFTMALKSESELNVNISAPGYLNLSDKLDVSGTTAMQHTVRLMKNEINKTFVLDNIYYNSDAWDILPDSEIELNKLVKIMNENPTLKIELGSHTDSRGSDQYNLVLSQKRSRSAVEYILGKGISKYRISEKGYGETQLLNRCKNGVSCSDEEHQINRRTEIKILGNVN